MSEVSEDVLIARAYLSRVAEPAHLEVWDYVREVGPIHAAECIRAGEVSRPVGAATSARRAETDGPAELDAARRHGIRLVVPESEDWPHFAIGSLERAATALLDSGVKRSAREREAGDPVPPLALWVAGDGELVSLGVRSVGLVGARSATAYGERVTTDLAYDLAGRDVVIVSGGAYGIDAAAHRAALAASGSTVIVSAGGIDRPYPTGNASLYDRARVDGLVLSESPPGSAPQRRRFLTRNRLIAAFATGTVVVEAAARSGAANTARHCFDIGRPVMAVPGPVTSPMSVGCHELLRRQPEPAILVTNAADVLDVVGGLGESPPDADGDTGRAAPPLTARQRRQAQLDALAPTARQVFDGLPARGWVRVEQIAQRSGTAAGEVIRALPTLELAGLIVRGDDGYRLVPLERKTSG